MKHINFHRNSQKDLMRIKFLFISAFILFLSTQIHGQRHYTMWVGEESGKAYIFRKDSLIELDFHRGIRSYLRNSVWYELDSFPVLREPDRIMLHKKPVVLSEKDTLLISFPGSGVVYGIDSKGMPIRMDKTFYSGYNFDSFRAMYKGKLYSIGGTGFWQRNGLVLFFDPALREWERLAPFYGMPEAYTMSFGARMDSTTYLLCNSPDKTSDPSLDDYRIYRVNLESRTAETIGVFSMDDGSREHNVIPIGYIRNYAFFDSDGFLLVGDVRSNKLYRWKDLTAGTGPYNGFDGVVLQNDTVNLIYSASTITNPSVRITKVPVEEVLQYCEDIERPIYRTTAEHFWRRYTAEFIIVLFALVFLVVFLVRYNLRQPAVEKQFVSQLNLQEVRLLRHLILLPEGRFADIQEIDLLLEVEGKSWENQRKIRSKSLSNINSLAEEMLGYRDFIQRKPNPEDKRARLYYISSEYRSSSPTLLRHL